jgi:predicted permease
MLSGVLLRLRALVFRRRVDAELDEEMRYHIEREVERNVANGMTADDARASAQRAFGNLTVATEAARDAWRWRWLEEARQDARYAARLLKRAPAFVATVTLTIGLGLGLLVTVFTLFNAYVLRPLAVRDPSALFEVGWHSRDRAWHVFTRDQIERLRASDIGFSQMFSYENLFTRIAGRPMIGQLVSGNYFDMLGVAPAIGRLLTPSDDAVRGSGAVIVLSYDTWRTQFGGDSNIVNRRITVSGVPLTVIGVARRGFGGLSSWPFQFWAPSSMSDPLHGWTRIGQILKGPESLHLVGRVAPRSSPPLVRAKAETWLARETAERPLASRSLSVLIEERGTSMPLTPEVWALFAPVIFAFGLVMLTACVNVANLMLARGLARQREIGIRLALGADRARLVRQLLGESIVLSLPAAGFAFVLSRVAIGVGTRLMYSTVPAEYAAYLRPVELSADLHVALFVIGGAIVAAITFGLAPALQATRPDIVRASRGDFDARLRPSRPREALVIAQVTASALLLISAAVLLGAARQFEHIDPGVVAANVVQTEVLERSRDKVLAQLDREPGIAATATSMAFPLDGILPGIRVNTATDSGVRAAFNLVSPTYFETLRLGVIQGRTFSESEAALSTPVTIVSASTARRLWPSQNPIGQEIRLTEPPAAAPRLAAARVYQVIGVVRDASPGWIGLGAHDPELYFPQPRNAHGAAILVRATGDADAARDRLDRALESADPGSVQETHTLESSLAVQAYPFRAAYWVAAGVGIIALCMTVTGVYGMLGYVVAQRRKEFGIRLALGAPRGRLVGFVLAQSLRSSIIGTVAGTLLAFGAARFIASVVGGIDAYDAFGYVVGVGVVLVACVTAAYLPSRRVAQVNPVEALRADS